MVTINDLNISEEALYFLSENKVDDTIIKYFSEFIADSVNKAIYEGNIDFSSSIPDEKGHVYLLFISVFSLTEDCSHSFKLTYGVLLHEGDYKEPLFVGIEKIELINSLDGTLDELNKLNKKPEYVWASSNLNNGEINTSNNNYSHLTLLN